MKMTKLRKVFVSILAIVAICCSIMSFTVFATGEATLEDASAITGFTYGQEIEMPTGKVKYGDEDAKKATVKIVFPNKTEVNEGPVTLNCEGNYTVVYSANFGGETKSVEQTFSIEKPLFYVKNQSSSVEYTTYKYSDHATAEYASDREEVCNSSVSGVQVKLAAGDVFEYSRVIDLNGKTSLDYLLGMVIAPNAIGVNDVDNFSVILTDAHDPSNYITVTTYSRTNPLAYSLSAASKSDFCEGQVFTGWEFNRDVKHVNGAGTPVRFSFTGPCKVTESETATSTSKSQNDVKYGINGIEHNNFYFSFDYANKQAHAPAAPNGRQIAHASSTTMFVDFDDPLHFENVWRGFTTGECFLSIKAGGYTGESFSFILTHLDGMGERESDAMGNLVDGDFETTYDRGPIEIELDLEGYSENALPVALVGTEYPLFDAITKNVYFGTLYPEYSITKGGEPVAKSENGFLPTEAGEYVVTYKVIDYIGREKTKSITINAVDTIDPAITFTPATIAEGAGTAGVYVDIADLEVTGGSGNCSVVATVKFGEENIPVENGRFFPAKSGTYSVTITATDYIGQTDSISYNVVVGNGNVPVAITKPALPKYFISGATYILPEIMFYDYTDGTGNPTAIVPTIVYEDGNGANIAIGREITPVAREDINTVKVTYFTGSYANMQGKLEYAEIPVINLKEKETVEYGGNTIEREVLRIERLLAGEGFTTKADVLSTTLNFSNDVNFDFANPLLPNELAIKFAGVKGSSSYDKVEITVTDTQNTDQTVKFIYKARANDTAKTDFYINSTSSLAYENTQSFANGLEFVLTINAFKSQALFNVENTLAATISTYLNGEQFKGFTSGKVYVNVAIKGVTEKSEFKIINIGGQPINNSTADRIAPIYAIEDEWLGYKKMGERMLIPKAYIVDAIDPGVVGTVTVRSPENEDGESSIVTSVDGVFLNNVPCDRDYYIDLKQYGGYIVTYSAVDASGNKLRNAEEFVLIPDLEAPEIKVSGKVAKTGKVGKQIALPTAVGIDALDGKCDVTVYLQAVTGIMHKMEKGKWAFVPNKAGVYRVIYTSSDSSNNMATVEYEITVK